MHLGYQGNGRHIEFFQPPKAATYCGGYSYKASWSLMKGIQNFFKSPLFCFDGNCSKVCTTDSNFVGLSHSTRCGCCSYQVSSISVRRVTCYDHFCVFFNFLAFWPFPWQRQPLWKNQHLKAQLHMAYDIPTRFHKVWSSHLREKWLKKLCGKWNNKNNNNNKKKQSKSNMSPKLTTFGSHNNNNNIRLFENYYS